MKYARDEELAFTAAPALWDRQDRHRRRQDRQDVGASQTLPLGDLGVRTGALGDPRAPQPKSSEASASGHPTRILGLGLLAFAACQGALDQRLAIVTEPRVLAIVSEPAEAKPGAQVAYSAVVASPAGPRTAPPPPSWALCTAPKPPTEDNAVSTACLGDGAVVDLGAGASVQATVPDDACMLFGPDVAGMGFRPRDPDATGGFYQPVRADAAGADLAFGFTRITCHLANAPADVAHDYLTMYVANANPTLAPLAISPQLGVDPDGAIAVAAHADLVLTAAWPAGAVESYLYFDPDRQVLVTRREAMHLAWYATSGALPVDASAVGEDDPTTSVTTTWRTGEPGPAWLWLVLRDSRGGIATQTLALRVE